jgi:hypothetical protein
MNNKFFFMDIPDKSIWEVKDVDTSDPGKLGWVTALCIEPGDDSKAFVGQKMGIDAGTVFNNTARYDVSMEPFHLTPLK